MEEGLQRFPASRQVREHQRRRERERARRRKDLRTAVGLVVVLVGLLLISVALIEAQGLGVGSRVQVTLEAAVRDAPGGATVLGTQPIGALGTVVQASPSTAWGFTWWQVNYDAGADGWTTGDRLMVVQDVPPGPPSAPTLTRRDVALWTVQWVWAAGGDAAATSAELERAATPTGPYMPLGTTAPGLTRYDDTAVVKGQAYCWRVRGRIGALVTPFAGVCTP